MGEISVIARSGVASPWWRRLIALCLLVLLLAPCPAFALTFPTLSGRVVDEAGLIPPALRDSLNKTLADLTEKSGDQLVVVTLPSLQGAEIADYGYQLGRHWGVGEAKLNNGVLLIIAPGERKVRIEVGYGLEGVLTDAASRAIIETAIVPKFRSGDMPGGVTAGVAAIAELLLLSPEEVKQRAAAAAKIAADETSSVIMILVASFIFMFVFVGGILFFAFRYLRRSVNASLARKSPAAQSSGKRTKRSADSDPISASSGSSSSGSASSSSDSGFSSSSGDSSGGGSFGGGGASGSW